MPRKARVDAPGALHHIICRGIERGKIFRDDQDRNSFVDRFGKIIEETSTTCYAWSLIPNHFHLLLKTGKTPISIVMRRLLTGHASYFNRRHRRHGHLFQNRYNSILCQEENYLLELVRYIHLNPIRARVVSDINSLEKYPYCGHGRLMGCFDSKWQTTGPVLLCFGKQLASARKKYAFFVEQGISQGKRTDLMGGGLLRSIGGWKELKALRDMKIRVHSDERILGDSDFVASVLREAEEALEKREQIRSQGIDFNKAAEIAAELFEISANDILASGKQPRRVHARSLLCYWAVRELGLKNTEVAEKLGIGQPAVSRAVVRGEKLAQDKGYSLKDARNA